MFPNVGMFLGLMIKPPEDRKELASRSETEFESHVSGVICCGLIVVPGWVNVCKQVQAYHLKSFKGKHHHPGWAVDHSYLSYFSLPINTLFPS